MFIANGTPVNGGTEVDYLTTAEVGELIRRPAETLRYWRWRGEGPPSFKIGRRVLYDRDELKAWIDAQKRNGHAAQNGAALT